MQVFWFGFFFFQLVLIWPEACKKTGSHSLMCSGMRTKYVEIVLPKLWIMNCHLHFADPKENALRFSEFCFWNCEDNQQPSILTVRNISVRTVVYDFCSIFLSDAPQLFRIYYWGSRLVHKNIWTLFFGDDLYLLHYV